MIVGLSGASGFVGGHVRTRLEQAGHEVKCLTRSSFLGTGELATDLRGCRWVINCAGQKRSDRNGCWKANEQLPPMLYRAAVDVGCSGMVHVSSVAALASVNHDAPVDDNHPLRPDNRYGASKARGDEALEQLRIPQTHLCILRPPLLISRDAGGLFGLLRRAALVGLPLPLSGIAARRSIMHADNFSAAVLTAIEREIDGTFIVTDGMTFTPPSLYRIMLESAGRSDRCFSIGPMGRRLLQKVLGTRRSNSLFASSEFDGARFEGLTKIRYPLPQDLAIADAMGADANGSGGGGTQS